MTPTEISHLSRIEQALHATAGAIALANSNVDEQEGQDASDLASRNILEEPFPTIFELGGNG